MNELVLTITPVTRKPAMPWVDLFTITLQNSIDNTDNYINNSSEEIPGYLDKEDREQLLDVIREWINKNINPVLEDIKIKIILEKGE